MPDTIFLRLLLNIGLLILIATVLTQVPVVRHMLLNENNSLWNRFCLALIFGLVSILSTYTGISAQGAIVNTRVIGVIAAGLLGGPSVGIGTAVIAGTHRYLFDIGGFTAVSCALSTFAEGMLGAAFSKYFRRGRLDSASIFLLTVGAEVCQMLIILLVARPFADALALVKIIAAPMIFLNAFGMVLFITIFNFVFIEEDNESAAKIKLAFQIVEQSLPHLKHGLHSRDDMHSTAQIIFRSIQCSGVMITDTKEVLAFQTMSKGDALLEMAQLPAPALDAMRTQQAVICSSDYDNQLLSGILKTHTIIAAPLIEKEQAVGSLVLIVKKKWHSNHADVSFINDLAKLFSTQLELSDLEYEKRLRKKAEFLALQSQVNPHFLYNALNTISNVCRENSDRARELLLVLATYYRQTLENDRFMISLHTELYHVKNYLELEKARFEEKLQVDIQVPEHLHGMVPAFILQPLVENAIRHGASPNGRRYVRISAVEEPEGIRIQVSDHGTGVSEEVIRQLCSGVDHERCFGLSNVHKRLQSVYGPQGGLQIDASPHGSNISFLISSRGDAELLNEENKVDNTHENSNRR